MEQDDFKFYVCWEWNQATAGPKLSPILSRSWFAQVLLPRLKFRPLPEIEAIQVLAEESTATKEYEPQLKTLLDYLETAGVIARDDGQVRLISGVEKPEKEPSANGQDTHVELPARSQQPDNNSEEYTLTLDREKQRRVTIKAPHPVTAEELKRIQAWLAVQLLVTGDEGKKE
jgi:hypothetical protein